MVITADFNYSQAVWLEIMTRCDAGTTFLDAVNNGFLEPLEKPQEEK